MRYETVTVRHGEYVSPVDWTHETARDKPQMWLEAERSPKRYLFEGREIISIGMYDGWPYWEPRPAIHFIGPLNSPEWKFFNSYGVNAGSITERPIRFGDANDTEADFYTPGALVRGAVL